MGFFRTFREIPGYSLFLEVGISRKKRDGIGTGFSGKKREILLSPAFSCFKKSLKVPLIPAFQKRDFQGKRGKSYLLLV